MKKYALPNCIINWIVKFLYENKAQIYIEYSAHSDWLAKPEFDFFLKLKSLSWLTLSIWQKRFDLLTIDPSICFLKQSIFDHKK